MRDNYTFIQEVMDQDTDPRLIEKGRMIDVVNMIAYDGKLQSVPGSTNVQAIIPSGHTCIGAKIYKNNLYWFSTNGTNSAIGRYDIDADDPQTFINVTWLGFSTSNRILDIDFLEDDSNNRLLMYWTDGLNEPRYTEINTLETYGATYYSGVESFSVIKAPPQKEPELRMIFSDELANNDIVNKSFTFAYRYIYNTGEKTSLSFYSRPAFIGKEVFVETVGYTQENEFNGVEITVPVDAIHTSTGEDIDKIEVFSKAAGSNVVSKIRTIDHDGSSSSYTFDFFSNQSYSVLSDSEAQLLYNNVPHKAGSQELIDNILIYGDYTDGLTNGITPDWYVESIHFNTSLTIASANPTYSGASSQYVDVSTTGQIYKGDTIINHFVLNEIATGDEYIFDVILVAENDYDNLEDIFNDPDARVEEIYNAHGIEYYYDIPLTTFVFEITASSIYRFSITKTASTFYNNLRYSQYGLQVNKLYDYGLVYYDKFNRSGEILEYKNVRTEPYFGVDVVNKPRVWIRHSPPSWAVKFKLLRKEYTYDYQHIEFDDQTDYDGYVYLRIEDKYAQLVSDEAKYIEYYATSRQFKVVKVEAVDSSHPGYATLGSGRFVVIEKIAGVYFTGVPIFVYFGLEIPGSTYEEIPGTYDVVNGYHTSEWLVDTDLNQSGASVWFKKILIYDGDVLQHQSFGAYKIDDALWYSPLGRATVASDNFKQQSRESSVTFSNAYVEDSGDNGLSNFDLSESNYKDYDRAFGPIKKIYSKDTNLVIFMEDKVINQPFRKNILSTIGQDAVVKSDLTLDTHSAYTGEYGMSHPESFAFRDNALFWLDAKRGEVMRLDVNGLFPISEHGMDNYFHVFCNENKNINPKGAYDPLFDEYLLYTGDSSDDNIFCYSRLKNGWRRKMTFDPGTFVYDGINVYAISGLDLHSLYSSTDYGNMLDYHHDQYVVLSANNAFSDLKVANAIFLEGSTPSSVQIDDTLDNSVTITEFEDKENFKYAYIPMGDDQKSLSIGGIGEASSVVQGGGETDLNVPVIPDSLSIGDSIYNGTTLIGTLQSKGTNSLNILGVGSVNNGDFIHYQKNSAIEGAPLRDYIFEVRVNFTTDGTYQDLFAVNLEVSKSQL